MKIMKRALNDISHIATSHKTGLKRVLLSAEESDCAIIQIAITDLKAGEVAEVHVHEDMQEGFYIISGELDVFLNEATEHCKAEDFVWVERGTSHELKAITDVKVMTIGCQVF